MQARPGPLTELDVRDASFSPTCKLSRSSSLNRTVCSPGGGVPTGWQLEAGSACLCCTCSYCHRPQWAADLTLLPDSGVAEPSAPSCGLPLIMAPGDKGVPGGRSDTPPAPLPMAASALMGLPPALAGTCTGRGVPSASAPGVVCMLGCWARKAAKAASLHSCVVQGWLSGMPTAEKVGKPWGIGLQSLPPDPRFPLPSNVHVAHSSPAF